MKGEYIKRVYSFYSSFYNFVFGWILEPRIKYAFLSVKIPGGKILEVGIGTGLSLPYYPEKCSITGIDISYPMLKKTQKFNLQCGRELSLVQMDACNLGFKDSSFDFTICAFVLSTIPAVEKALHEIWRVTKPEGRVLIINHFISKNPIIRKIEKGMDPFTKFIGWKSDFPEEVILSTQLFKPIKIERKHWFSPWKVILLQPIK